MIPRRGGSFSKDPIGLEGGDVNLFRYVGNDPGNWMDSLGLLKIKGAHNKPIFITRGDPDPLPSKPHGHIGNPDSPIKVNAYTGEIYYKAEKTGEVLSNAGLQVLSRALKKAGLLGLALSLIDILTAEDALAAIGEMLDPFNLIKGELAADDLNKIFPSKNTCKK